MGALTHRVALGVVVLLAWATPAVAAPTVKTSFVPAVVEFGDPVTARIVVVALSGNVRLVSGVAPLTQLGPARETRVRQGGSTVVVFELPAVCITDRCLRAVTPPPAQVTVDGTPASAPWPALEVRGRVSASDLSRVRPGFVADTALPPPSFRFAPSTLALALELVAAVLAVAGVALVGAQAAAFARRRGRATHEPDGLARALRLARQAESRPAPDRRRAVGLLARLLGDGHGRLADRADDLAWSRPQPEPTTVSALVDEVEREVQP